MPASKTLGACIIITYLGFKETDFCRKNIMNNLILKHLLFLSGKVVRTLCEYYILFFSQASERAGFLNPRI